MSHFRVTNANWTVALACFFLITFVSCQKEVHISLGTTPSEVVVEGAVQTNLPPYVILTSTIGFFTEVNLANLQSTFLHGAKVTVSDGSQTVTLKEYSFDTGNNTTFYIYSIDTSNLSSGLMVGIPGRFYTLTINYNNQTYSAVTKIPQPKGIDSMWFAKPLLPQAKTPDSAMQLFINYTDPDTPGNYVRYFTRIDQQPFYPSDQFNDMVVNGTKLTNIPLYAGYAPLEGANGDSLIFFYPGDTVTLEWAEIDRNTYNFWNTFSYANNILGNPFASPINLQTNLTNGALGIWAGYGSLFYTKVVQ